MKSTAPPEFVRTIYARSRAWNDDGPIDDGCASALSAASAMCGRSGKTRRRIVDAGIDLDRHLRGSATHREPSLFMGANKTRLPHVLAPSTSSSRAFVVRDVDKLFVAGWHFAGTNRELARRGDFIACEIFGTPIIERRHDDPLVTFVNVCAHRHARLTHVRFSAEGAESWTRPNHTGLSDYYVGKRLEIGARALFD